MIEVQVIPEYLPEQSQPERERFTFAYHITIINQGDEAAQLISRHWLITDANEKIQEVKGQGVIGKQPWIQPGESYQYSSGAVIETAFGTMEGSYQMVSQNGDTFDAKIPAFTLAKPGLLH